MSKVSVIMPAHNSEQHISSAIESVIAQSFNNWELLVIDDCSTDSTKEIVKNYCALDKRVFYIELTENVGAAKARNIGIESSTGRYIAFLDSDDKWDKNKLEKQISFMKENCYAFTFTGYRRWNYDSGIIENEGGYNSEVSYQSMLRSNKIGCLTVVFDTQMVGKQYMPELRKRQDYAMWLKLLRLVGKAYGITEPLATYTVRKDSISSNKLSLIKYNYLVFRQSEGLSLPSSLYYLTVNVMTKIVRGFNS